MNKINYIAPSGGVIPAGITTSGWMPSEDYLDSEFMRECWRRTKNREKCELCELKFKCYTKGKSNGCYREFN